MPRLLSSDQLRGLIGAELIVFALALAARLSIVAFSSGGFGGLYPYDPGVYYAASDALSHGLLPYRDFLLVHPPGLPIVLLPFAYLGRLTTDHVGFLSANLAGTVLGAINAVLVVRLGRRLGFGRPAAAVGGLLYAVCLGSAVAEFDARLEPVGNALLLCALFCVAGRQLTARRALAAGALLGCAVDVKLWWLAPLAIVAVAVALLARSMYRGILVLAGAAVSIAVVLTPFFIAGPRHMFHMIVQAQLDRTAVHTSIWDRLTELVTTGEIAVGQHQRIALSIGLIIGLAVTIAVAVKMRPASRLFATLLVVQVSLLLIGPAVFGFYVDYVMVSASIVLAAAADAAFGATRKRLRWVGRAWTAAAVSLAATVLIWTIASPFDPGGYVTRFPATDRMVAAADQFRCVVSDSPDGLILLNALDRSFEPGCRDWVDISAPTIGALGKRYQLKRGVINRAWPVWLQRYLTSGDAVLVIRKGIGLTGDAKRAFAHGGKAATDGKYTLYRTVPTSRLVHP